MKKISLLLLSLFALQILWGQTSGGPDAFGYTWRSNWDTLNPIKYSWYDISTKGTQVTDLEDDNNSGPYYFSPGFQYYWSNITKFWIGSNGYISFDGDNISSPFPFSIPINTGANNFIAPLLSDLSFDGQANPALCYYYTNADTICVSFEEVPYWYVNAPKYTGENSFQIILSRVDSSITFNYISMRLGFQTLVDNIVGIENISGTVGLNPFTDSILTDTFSIKFFYPKTVTFQAIDAGMNWNDNEGNGGTFHKAKGAANTLRANVKNYGNVALSNFTVLDTVFDAAGQPVTSGSATVGSLPVGVDTTVVFSNTFAPSDPGIYTYTTYVMAAGDIVPNNNTISQEMVVVDTSGLMTLEYTDTLNNGGGLSWNGGDGGLAIYIAPPVYPAKVIQSRFYISANANNGGFYAKIYDDDGPNGGHGTLLDSVFVNGTNVNVGAYNYVTPDSTVTIDSGGVYLVWYMDGPFITLGANISQPISRRTIEVIGQGWGAYRSMRTQDFLLGLEIDYAFPRADFTVLYGADPELEFVDESTNDPTTWYWTFGDGDTSTAQNPKHTYLENKKYEVCLTVTNAFGSNTICDTVNVTGVIPTAFFTYNDSAFPTIAFKDESIGPPTSWKWNLADTAGPNVIIQNPVYRFRNNGIRNVCLTAININGSSAPYCEEIEITGVGLAELLSNFDLKVQPNPFSDFTTIFFPENLNAQQVTFMVYNALGAQVDMSGFIEQNKLVLKKGSLNSGTYYVKIYENAQPVATMPLILE